MGFFGKLLHGSETTLAVTPPTRAAAPASAAGISYDPTLVNSLLHDHEQLGAIYARIGEVYKAGDFDEMRRLLAQFKSRLQAHVLTENVRFYNYLEQNLQGDRTDAELMHDFRRDMNDIARNVIAFTKKYSAPNLSIKDRATFATDYANVLGILEQRLDSEESSLYPLYRAP